MKAILPPKNILEWHLAAGADETVGEQAVNRFDRPGTSETQARAVFNASTSSPLPTPTFSSSESGKALPLANIATESLAQKASTLEELRQIIQDFDECPLKATATQLVFATGNPHSKLMIIGEAPGAEEDKQGLPFVGASGHLLDLMLASIGLNRESVYISNILPWRPPGNRKPSESEVALFTPFVRKHISLVNPKVLLLLGGSAVSALMHTNAGITRSRGHWMTYHDGNLQIDTMASFHPAFLLRTPAQKKLSWRDFLTVKKNLEA